LRHNTHQLLDLLKRELELREKKLLEELHQRTLERIFIEQRIYKKIESCKTNDAIFAAVREGLKPHSSEIGREVTDTDIEHLLGIRIRRISQFDIAKHKQEIQRARTDLANTRRHLKNLTAYAIGHLEGLLNKYGPLYPRLTKISRHDEIDAREVAFKAFRVGYDRQTGYVGFKVNGSEFRTECTRFDRILLVFMDGRYKVVELPEKLFVGPDLVYCGLPERDRVFTMAYSDRSATYLKRFTFGGYILDKEYLCVPQGEKSRILFFAPDTPDTLYIRYKPAPYQKINQQTCSPAELEVKGPRTKGRQISIKEVASITPEPPRSWDPAAPTTRIVFA
ncbi:MAG: DNA topoisomerase IV subunit A, partial [Verrucomicrobiae bacterium]|nr:DNA topoisomerase IV subunit A [Verrucomicrobiae bacterium]